MIAPRFPVSQLTFGARWSARIVAALCAGLALASAQATTVCVSTVPALQAALLAGTFQNQAYTIRIVQGTYPMNAGMVYQFSAPTTIEGGYTANCADRVADASNTVINFGQMHALRLTQAAASPEAELNVDGVTFTDILQAIELIAGEFVDSSTHHSGSVRLSRVRFTNIGSGGGIIPLTVEAHTSEILLENVLIDDVSATGLCAVVLTSDFHASVRLNHVTADLGSGSNFCLGDSSYAAQVYIHNSILWSSDGLQNLSAFRDSPAGTMNSLTSLAFVNSIFAGLSTAAQATAVNTINANPKWVDPSSGNYRLATSGSFSPAINSGTIIVPVGEPATDIAGGLRVVGSAPDRGAYESSFNNFSILTVTNTLNSGAGSLRQALLDANSSPNIAKSIKFDVRDAGNVPLCPAVIHFNTTLPEIAAPISIDGYTQPTSLPNTDDVAFNAQLCVLLKPVSGSLATAFRVPQSASAAVSLKLRGVGLGGFGQPVHILGGSDHLIAGNQFGGQVNGVNLPGAGLSAITLGLNAGGSLIIGGQNAADRNVIGGAGVNGISIQAGVQSSINDCQIINNLIGLTPDGLSELANNVGVNVNGSGCALVRNRIAGNTLANLWINGGNNNVIQQNRIGLTANESGLFNSAIGVVVQGSNNLIGASGNGGTIAGNVIRYNNAGGVVIRGNTSTGNSVRANLLDDNGFDGFDGEHMDIDLQVSAATVGPDANDVGDVDEGPNRGQNFPVPTGLVYTAAGVTNRPATVSGVLDSKAGSYRVDVYFSSDAHDGRGHAELYLGLTDVTISGVNPRPVTFSKNILVPNQLPGGVISFTATDAAGNTSEMGTAISIIDPFVFANGFE